MPAGYLKRILNAKVYDVARETDLEYARHLSERTANRVWLKREDQQPVFSFKLRGAYNKMAQLGAAELARGVITASAGNHAQGVALAAARMGCKATIVMPVTTPLVKVNAVKSLGGKWVKTVLHGLSYSDAYQYAQQLEQAEGLSFVHPFDDPDVIAGQGTVAMEILRQHQGPITAVFVAIGGGGLIAGMAAYIKSVRPDIKVIGVQTVDSDAMKRSVDAGKRVELKDVGLFADGTAVKLVGKETYRLTKALVDDIVLVDTDALCAAIQDIFEDTRSIVEPSGALAVAGLKVWAQREQVKDQALVAVTSGANMNFSRLRFVSERAEIGEAREALFAVTLPEERGSFRHFCEVIGKHNVTEFNYRIADAQQAHIFVGIAIPPQKRSPDGTVIDSAALASAFRAAGFATLDLTHDELAKSHVRHMVGGHSPLAQDELLYRFEFPERPGALMTFLTAMHPNWNISLFHYRNHGADYGRILVGIQVPPNEKKEFARFLKTLGYPHWDETANPAYRLFL